MTKLEMKINKLINKLVRMSIMMGYNVQQSDSLELNKYEIYQLVHVEHITEIEIIKRFIH